MKIFKRSGFDDPHAVAAAASNAFLLYVRTIGLNDAALARAALDKVREQIAEALAERGYSASDRQAIEGLFSLAVTALAEGTARN